MAKSEATRTGAAEGNGTTPGASSTRPPSPAESTPQVQTPPRDQEEKHAATARPRPSTDTLPEVMSPLPVPQGAPSFIRDILVATNHYYVLGEEQEASVVALHQAKRALSLATHPDKAADVPGAHDACVRVIEAANVLLDPRERTAYDKEVETVKRVAAMPENQREAFRRAGPDFSRFSWFDCHCCRDRGHMCLIIPGRHPDAARWCDSINDFMPVAEGETWVEEVEPFGGLFKELSEMLGGLFRFPKFPTELHLFICERGKVFDITAVGECSDLLRQWKAYKMPTNTPHNHMNCWNAGCRNCGGVMGEFGAGGGQGCTQAGWWAAGDWAAGGWGVGGGGDGTQQSKNKKKNTKKKKGRR